MAQKVESLKDEGTRSQVIISGAVAGLVSRFIISPLDVIKIRLQLQTHRHSLVDPLTHSHSGPTTIYRNTLDTFWKILTQEGPAAFWKGNIPAEALYLTYGAIQFSTYHACTSALESLSWPSSSLPSSTPGAQTRQHPPTSVTTFISGALAGGIATTLTYPLDLLRTRFAAQGNGPHRVYTSLYHSIRDISRHEGSRGFFQGLGAAITQIVPYMGLFFAGYEALKLPLSTLSQTLPIPLPGGSSDALAGMTASILAKTAVFPLDTVRKRLQVQGPTRTRYVNPHLPVYRGVLGTVRAILGREGVKGLYRGLPVSLVKAAPTSAVTMWTYERCMRFLQDWAVAEEP